MTATANQFVVLGAGVAGLATATTLLSRVPESKITIVAKYFPGDVAPTEYCSPQAGANWMSFESELNQYAKYDEYAFKRFLDIVRSNPESGVRKVPLRLVYGKDTPRGMKHWYEKLLGGMKDVPKEEIPEEADWAVEGTSLVINTGVYLNWPYAHIEALFADFPETTAVFNCTGLGARHLGGVEDKAMYPTKGQTVLVAEPKDAVTDTYVWTQPSLMGDEEFSHIFPRPLGGGIILGGIRLENDWSDTFDAARAERIKERACKLCPRLGKPEELQVVKENVGLRLAKAVPELKLR
ncbi:hypothetical protein KEM55_003820 [Ascosphaera atra]|nr:hypothetical protein KEM55_003820 [Ascosphaera atra]